MRRAVRIGAGFCLAFLIVTCTDKNVTGPRGRGSAALDLSAFQAGPTPGLPDIPLDSVRVVLREVPGLALEFDTVLALRADTLAPDSLRLDLHVTLDNDPETFQLTVSAYGGGTVWYVATDTTTISTTAVAKPRLTAIYVGPGAGATGVTLAPRDTTVVGGQSVTLRVTVDSSGTTLVNVPVGIVSGDTTKGKVTQPTYTGGVFTGKSGIRDSVWLYVETPTHLRDSTRIHVVPPPSQLVKISGDSQAVIVNAASTAPLTVRVEDALSGGSPGVPVTWTVTQGTATFSPPSPINSDTGGYARVTVTPSSLGTVKVQASATGLTGSPITFTINVLAGVVHQVIVAPKLDTLAFGSTFQFAATLKDSLGNVVTSVKPVWTSSNPAVATVDSTGLATGLGGDSTLIVAAAGGFADTARLLVRTPAKIALTPSDTVITSIGDSVHLSGVVLTNLGDTVKSGVAIRFASTTPTVATVGAATGEAHLVGSGNGVVLATDTFQVVIPAVPTPDTLRAIAKGTATLRVNQKAVGIVNSPPDSIEVGVNGQAQILATAIDKNGHPIPGKSFGWLTRNPSVATVNQSGVVTGVSIGAGPTYAVDTLVDSVTVLRDSTLVSVVPSPPPVMRWAFDTLAIGNGGNTTVNVSLNVPSAAGTVLQIVSADTTKVKPTQTRIAIGTGGANASVTLQGVAATLAPVDVVAQDSAGVYKPDTLRVIVVSTIFFAQVGQTTRASDFYLNQNETLNGQVFLSDPAPAGGLGVTFIYAKGFSTSVPTTVVIPQGQLAAPVQFLGVGAGTDSVIPSSGAFVGKFSYLHVAKDTLIMGQPYPYTGVIGLGQTEQPYVQIPNSMDHPLPFTIAVTPAIGTVTPNPDTILTSTASRYFTVTGTALGTATISVSASKWLSTTLPLIVTTPQLIASGSSSMVAGNPTLGGWNAYSGDTTRYTHPVVLPLTVHIVSRDTAVVKVVQDSLTIAATQNYNSVSNALFAQAGAGGDSTWLVETAPGYQPDSFLVHVTKPTMTAAYSFPYDGRVALNTTFPQPIYVQIPYARTDTFALVLKHSNQAGPQAPDTLFIPKGQTIGYLASITGVSLGVDTVTIDTVATKPGYVMPTGAVWVLHIDPLHVRPYSYPTSLVTISPPSVINAYVYDSASGFTRALNSPMTVTLALSRPNVVTLDSTKVIIPAGSAYSNYDTLRVAVGVNAPDSTRILTTAAGSSPDSGSFIKVTPTALLFNIGNGNVVGRGLRSTGNYVYLPAAAPNTLSVALGRTVAGKDSLVPLSVTIPKGQSSSSIFDIWAFDSIATDTITASAPGFVTAKGTVFLVRDTIRLGNKPGATMLTTAPPIRLFGFLFNTTGYNQRPFSPTTVTFTSSDPLVISLDSGTTVNGALDTATALVDTTQQYGIVRLNAVNPGTAYVRAFAPGFGADSFSVTVTGPSLSFSSTSLTVGTQQLVTQYVTVQNAPASPVTVTLQRSDSTAAPGSQVFGFSPTVVTIPAGQFQSNVDTVVGQNIGVAQLLARANGYGGATATIQVGKPQLVTNSSISLTVGAPPTGVGLNADDQSGITRYVTAPVTVTAAVSDPTVATVDSATRVIQAGSYTLANPFKFSGLKKGAVQAIFSASGYKPDTMLITVDTGTLSLGAPFSLGVGEQEQGNVYLPYVTSVPVTVNLSATNPGALTVPSSVIIPANQSNVTYTMLGTGIGTSQVNGTATGFKNATPPAVIVSAARLVVSASTTGNAGQPMSVTIYAEDTLGSSHPVTNPVSITLASNGGAHAAFATNPVTILAGSAQAFTTVTFDTAGVFNVTATATGFETGSQTGLTVSGVEIKVGVGNTTTFTPGTDTLAVNHYATWVWDATNTLSHGVHWLSAPGSLPGDSPTQTSGSYSVYFSTPGTYTYECTVHLTAMTGTIVVQ